MQFSVKKLLANTSDNEFLFFLTWFTVFLLTSLLLSAALIGESQFYLSI